jgi:hypothetical protein
MPKLLFLILAYSLLLSCQETPSNQAYIDKGIAITDSAGMALVSQLIVAMQEGGVPNAIAYCNQQALPITAHQSEKYGVKISRVALRNRNEQNIANKEEQTLFVEWENAIGENEPLHPKLLTVDKKKVFYRPITMKPMCLSCHGEVGTQISNENYEVIKSFYPHDKAINFADGSLRGAWKVEF